MNGEETGPETARPAPPGLPLKMRAFYGVAAWFILVSCAFISVPQGSAWRISLAIAFVVPAIFFAIRIKAPPPAPRPRPPNVEVESGVLVQLVQTALERADRATHGWLTVVGAAVSILVAGLVGFRENPFLSSAEAKFTLLGAALLGLGAVSYAGKHFIETAREQSKKALNFARNATGLGAYYTFVNGEDSDSWHQYAPASVLGALGYTAMNLGFILFAIGFVISF